MLHTAKKPEQEIPQRIKVPDFAHLLPEPIRRFTTKGVYDADDKQHLSFIQGAGHGGSHPHLVHEFVSALVENRDPFPTPCSRPTGPASGFVAHESALKGGRDREAAEFTFYAVGK